MRPRLQVKVKADHSNIPEFDTCCFDSVLACLQGDINHWVAVLDYFDGFFEQQIAQRSDVQLQDQAVQDPRFPTETCLAVLHTTCVLLENCNNKAAYTSSEVRQWPQSVLSRTCSEYKAHVLPTFALNSVSDFNCDCAAAPCKPSGGSRP